MAKFITVAGLSITMLTATTPAYAYLDPGTGSIILQGLIAGVAVGTTLISMYYWRFKEKIMGFFGKNKAKKTVDIEN